MRAANFIQPDEFPYDQGLVFQDGRELEYDSGDYPASLEKLKELVGWDEFPAFRAEMAAQGRRVGIGLACYVEGTGVGPYEGAHVHVETSGKVKVATGLTTQGQGHATVFAQMVADELGVPLRGRRGGHRRHPADAVRRGHLRLPRRGDERLGDPPRREAGQGEGAADRRRGARGRRAATSRSSTAWSGSRGPRTPRIDLGTVSVLSNPLRYAFDEASKAATQFSVGDPGKPPVAEDDEPGLEGRDFYSPERSTFASGMHAVIVETDPDDRRDHDPEVRRGARLRPPDQPDDRRGPDPRRRRPGHRRRALRADGLRRVRAAAQRLVHGLPDALRHRGAGLDRDRPPRDALAAQPARHQGRRRGRGHPLRGGLRRGDRGRRGPSSPGSRSPPCPSRRPSCSSCASARRPAPPPKGPVHEVHR